MTSFEWITAVSILLVLIVSGYSLWNHFRFSNREYRKIKKETKDW